MVLGVVGSNPISHPKDSAHARSLCFLRISSYLFDQMIQPSDIPHLLHLLDDDSSVVQEQIQQAFLGFGETLESHLIPFLADLKPKQKGLLHNLCKQIRERQFEMHWLDWLDIQDERLALESGLAWLSYRSKAFGAPLLSPMLDQLTNEFKMQHAMHSIPRLMHFLFVEKGFSAPKDEYYDVQNSNLIHVMDRREGLQISLAVIAILIGRRLKLELYGFNMPGHFMIVSAGDRGPRIYDPFNKGKALPSQTMSFLDRSLQQQHTSIAELRADTHEIILRVINNLINVHNRRKEQEELAYYQKIGQQLVSALQQQKK